MTPRLVRSPRTRRLSVTRLEGRDNPTPVLSYSPYAPGAVLAEAVDSAGNAYLAQNGGTVTKLNPAGTAAIYSTQLTGGDYAVGIAVDRAGDAFVLLTGSARGAIPRQRTLEASVQWSHDLLAPPGLAAAQVDRLVQGQPSPIGAKAPEWAGRRPQQDRGAILLHVGLYVRMQMEAQCERLRFRGLDQILAADVLAAFGHVEAAAVHGVEWFLPAVMRDVQPMRAGGLLPVDLHHDGSTAKAIGFQFTAVQVTDHQRGVRGRGACGAALSVYHARVRADPLAGRRDDASGGGAARQRLAGGAVQRCRARTRPAARRLQSRPLDRA